MDKDIKSNFDSIDLNLQKHQQEIKETKETLYMVAQEQKKMNEVLSELAEDLKYMVTLIKCCEDSKKEVQEIHREIDSKIDGKIERKLTEANLKKEQSSKINTIFLTASTVFMFVVILFTVYFFTLVNETRIETAKTKEAVNMLRHDINHLKIDAKNLTQGK